jgi:hypothetical protein
MENSITLRDLLDNPNRLFYLTQKLVDYAANKKLNPDEVVLTLSVNDVYEAPLSTKKIALTGVS